MSLLLTLDIFHTFFWCFYCWLTACKCMLGTYFLSHERISVVKFENSSSLARNCSSWSFEVCGHICIPLKKKVCCKLHVLRSFFSYFKARKMMPNLWLNVANMESVIVWLNFNIFHTPPFLKPSVTSGLYHHGQNIFRLFHVLAQLRFTKSESELDYYHQKVDVQVAWKASIRLKT